MSKELEALKDLAMLEWLCSQKGMLFDWERIRKPLKALEIIKDKRVNIHQFVSSNNLKLIDYNYLQNKERELTQEEYDLLKEVLL